MFATLVPIAAVGTLKSLALLFLSIFFFARHSFPFLSLSPLLYLAMPFNYAAVRVEAAAERDGNGFRLGDSWRPIAEACNTAHAERTAEPLFNLLCADRFR